MFGKVWHWRAELLEKFFFFFLGGGGKLARKEGGLKQHPKSETLHETQPDRQAGTNDYQNFEGVKDMIKCRGQFASVWQSVAFGGMNCWRSSALPKQIKNALASGKRTEEPH